MAITLYCLFAITDSATMDPYQSVRIAATLAIGLGFHIDREDLPLGQREMRKRIFWSIYGMDRSSECPLKERGLTGSLLYSDKVSGN